MGQYPFRRLQADLAKMIASLPAESRLPSEPELARRMGVSRATLREAMRSFEGQGLIRRRQGVGTFVVAKVPVIDFGLGGPREHRDPRRAHQPVGQHG